MEDTLVEQHRGLVKSIIKNQFNPRNQLEFQELEQAGLIGLMKAIRKHNDKKAKLTTYAYYYILGEIKDFIRQEKYSHIQCQRSCVPCTTTVESKRKLSEYLDKLSFTEQTIISMRMAGYSFAEISSKLECSTTWVHKQYEVLIARLAQKNNDD